MIRQSACLAAALLACRAPRSRDGRGDALAPAPSRTPVTVAPASASNREPVGPTKKCGDAEATLAGGAVASLAASPASILLARSNGKRALVLSDPKWPDCDIVVEEARGALSGPFSGASGSDAKWKAVFYSSMQNVFVAVLDASGAVRGLAPVPCTPYGNQGRIESRDVFADGHTIFYSGYVSADGWDQLESHLFGFVDGKFAALFTDEESLAMGSAERYDVTTSAVGATPPTVTVDLAVRESVVGTEDGGFRTLAPRKKHSVARWNGRAFR